MKEKLTKKGMLILIVFIGFTATTYALFRAVGNLSGDLALAVWEVTLNQDGEANHLSIMSDPQEINASYTLNVRSRSEVDIVYTIVIDNLPTGVSISLDNGAFIQETNNKVVYTDVGTILYSDTSKRRIHTITFKASATSPYVDDQEVDIDVIARQMLVS